MTRRSSDGPSLLVAIGAAVANLERHVEEINALNVFPVPDGDTGSNMLATMRAALEEGHRVAEPGADRIAAAISLGALMGARGNSGVITSQILRGIAEGLAGRRRFNALDLADALRLGADRAYGAVAKPVEGTMLTVARAAAQEAIRAAEDSNDMDAVFAAAAIGAERAVAQTPAQLPILKEAGVVDAGGQGLYRMLQGVTQALSDRRTHEPAVLTAPRPSTLVAHADEGFGYETMFLVQPRRGDVLDVDEIRRHLEGLGDSVLVAGDGHAAKVHVHNAQPDAILAYGLSLGVISRISIENMDSQARDMREQRALEFAGGVSAGPEVAAAPSAHAAPAPVAVAPVPAAAGVPSTPTVPAPARREALAGLGVIAVAAGDGLARIFESFGSTTVVSGGQADNPSTGEMLAAVAASSASDLLLLPNNPNVVLTARLVAILADRRIHVVPTRNAAEGIAALFALDPAADATSNAEAMIRAGRAIQSLQVTDAVRDAAIGGRQVRRGETIVLDPDDGLVAVGRDADRTVLKAIGTLRPGYELLTIYYGEDTDLGLTEVLARAITACHPGLEVEVLRGGQPHYRYLISAE